MYLKLCYVLYFSIKLNFLSKLYQILRYTTEINKVLIPELSCILKINEFLVRRSLFCAFVASVCHLFNAQIQHATEIKKPCCSVFKTRRKSKGCWLFIFLFCVCYIHFKLFCISLFVFIG